MKCKNCGAEFEEGIFCPECGTRVENIKEDFEDIDTKEKEDNDILVDQSLQDSENTEESTVEEVENKAGDKKVKHNKKTKRTKKKSKGKIIFGIVVVIFLIIALKACFSSNGPGGYGKDAQAGTYQLEEGRKYPNVVVSKWKGSSNDISNLVFSVQPDENNDDFVLMQAKRRDDGTYCLEGNTWNYLLSFNGKGRVKVELEATGNSKIAAKISKIWLKKAVGTYKYFEAASKSVDESIADAVYEMDHPEEDIDSNSSTNTDEQQVSDQSSSSDEYDGDLSISDNDYDYEALNYAGEYESEFEDGYKIIFNAYSSVDSDVIGTVEIYNNDSLEYQGDVCICNDSGDWDASDYDAFYSIPMDGYDYYLGFSESNGEVMLDYNGNSHNITSLIMTKHYES